MGWGCFAVVSALELQQFCVKPFVGHANLIRCIYWRLEEKRDGAVSRVVFVIFLCSLYCKMAERWDKDSPLSGCSQGSVATLWPTLARSEAIR